MKVSFKNLLSTFPEKVEGNPASVLVPVMLYDGKGYIVFTRRSFSLRDHPGEVCFPGGRFDPSKDKSLVDTALREMEEELGVGREVLDIKGRLPEVKTITSNFTIYPFVATMPKVFLKRNREEVMEVIKVPLRYLLREDVIKEGFTYMDGRFEPVLFVPFKRYLIWGATAIILKHLLERIEVEGFQGS